MPNAYTFLSLGIADYNTGNYSAAVDRLQTAYDMAGRTAPQGSCWMQSFSSAVPIAIGRIFPIWSVTTRSESGWRRICKTKSPAGYRLQHGVGVD